MAPHPRTLSRRVAAPLAAFTMAGLLFIYARTSIRAAKNNAQRHREADGGQISWHRETLRRHGALDTPGQGDSKTGGGGSVKELVGELKSQLGGKKEGDHKLEDGRDERVGRTLEDERIKEMRGRRGS